MHDKPCRLVHHHEVGVLIHHVERNVLRLYRGIMARTVEHERHHIAGTHFVVALHGAVVHMHETGVGGLLYAVAAGVLHLLAHELIHTHGLHARVGIEAEVFVKLA